MTGSLISVVITTHHRLELLRQALCSIESQTTVPLEVVIVDDGHTLDVSDIAQLERRHPFVHVLPADHGGISRARNIGAQHITGNFVLFLDDDDELAPIAIEEFTRLHQAFPHAIALVGGCQPFSTTGDRVYRASYPSPTALRDDLWRRNPICSVGAVAVARQALMEVGGWDVEMPFAMDYMLWLKLSRIGDFAVSSKILLRYRQHDRSISSKGLQYFHLLEFKQAFRRNFPALVRSKSEDVVLAAIVSAQGTEALWYLRRLIVTGRLGEVIHLMPRYLRGTMIAIESPRRIVALCKAVYRTTIATLPGIMRGALRRVSGHSRSRDES